MGITRKSGGSGGGGRFAVSIAIQAKDRASRIISGVAAHLRASLGRIKDRIKGIVDFGAKLGTVFATFGRAIVGVGSKIAGVVGETSDYLSTIADLAKKTGISTRTLQELGFAAEQSGVQAEALTGGVDVMTRKFGEMQAGSKELFSFLSTVGGPAFAKAAKGAKTNEERLELMLGALSQITDEERRAAFASKVFGKAGEDIALMAADGADNLRNLRQQAHEFNVVVGEDGVASAEEFGDEMDKLGKSWSGAKRSFGVEVMRELLPMLKEMTEWIRKNPEKIREIARELASGVASAVEGIRNAIEWIWSHREDILGWAKALAIVFGAGGILGSIGGILAGLKALKGLIPGGGGGTPVPVPGGGGGGLIGGIGRVALPLAAGAMVLDAMSGEQEARRASIAQGVMTPEFVARKSGEFAINGVIGNAMRELATSAGPLGFAQPLIGAATKRQDVNVTVTLTGPGAAEAQVTDVKGAAKVTRKVGGHGSGKRTAGTGL